MTAPLDPAVPDELLTPLDNWFNDFKIIAHKGEQVDAILALVDIMQKDCDAYATDRVEQAVVEALESIVSRHYAEDFGTYDFDGIAEDVLEALTPPPTNGEAAKSRQ